MNSEAMALSDEEIVWQSVAGDPWFMRSSPYSEPNGDYVAGCWLIVQEWSEEGFVFNDQDCEVCSTDYFCSTNGVGTSAPSMSPPPSISPAPTTASPTVFGSCDNPQWLTVYNLSADDAGCPGEWERITVPSQEEGVEGDVAVRGTVSSESRVSSMLAKS